MTQSRTIDYGFGAFAGLRLREAVGTLVHDLREAGARRAAFNRTLGELNRLSDRELADLGFSRHDLRRIARDSVYGA